MASFNRNVSGRDQDPLAGMASLNKLAWPVSSSWHGQSQRAGLASRNKLVWPALTRELLAGTKNTQTVAGMASPHSLRQEPESDLLVGMASLNSNVSGRNHSWHS